MAGKDSDSKTTVLVPIIVAVVGLIGIMMQTDWFAARMAPPTPTAAPTVTVAVAIVPTSEPPATAVIPPTVTDIPATPTMTSTVTPIPLPLEEIFPQVGMGEAFVFVNNPAVFTSDFVRDECVYSGVYGLKLAYDVKNSGNAGWGVQWVKAPNGYIDLTEYSALVFWVKAGTGAERFQIGIKDDMKREQKIESRDLIVLSQDWQLVRVPLNRFRDVNLGFVNNINFGFNTNHSNGVLCVDEIYFEK